jgi:hypothetical protein
MACHRSIFLLRRQQLHQRDLLVEDHLLVGGYRPLSWRPVTARAHLEQGLELSATQQSSTPSFAGGYHPAITSLAWIPRARWESGYADQAQQRSQEALALARHVAHTPSPAFAESYAALHFQSGRDGVATQACAEALMALASQQGFVVLYEQGRRALTHRTC